MQRQTLEQEQHLLLQAANGFTVVDDIVYIQRGYERFEEKLSGLGAIIAKVDSEKEERKFKLKVG